MTEPEWVETLKADIKAAVTQPGMTIETGFRLPYAFYVSSYREGSVDPATTNRYGYQTDLLIAERVSASTDWVPRVVVEFKLGTVTTHDALTYSAKAATHKNVHPYLRYGIIIGRHAGPVPRRLVRHGHQFDFMQTLASEKLNAQDRDQLFRLLRDEIRASRTIETLLSGKSDMRLVHRKLVVTGK